jgi:hypothetical protein
LIRELGDRSSRRRIQAEVSALDKIDHRVVVAGCIAVLLCFSGCSDGASSSTSEGTVSGVVTLLGKPVSGGQVQFDAANINRKDAPQRYADIGKDGRYTIKALVGSNRVTPLIPSIGRGGDLRRAVKSIEVNSGENQCDIDIPAFAPPPGYK